MPVFTCHAECEYDVEQLRHRLTTLRHAGTVTSEGAWLEGHQRGDVPDRDVTITTDRDIHFVRWLLNQIQDSHVMLRTLEEGTFAERFARRQNHGR